MGYEHTLHIQNYTLGILLIQSIYVSLPMFKRTTDYFHEYNKPTGFILVKHNAFCGTCNESLSII
jgi:hypothetical protein